MVNASKEKLNGETTRRQMTNNEFAGSPDRISETMKAQEILIEDDGNGERLMIKNVI